MASVQALLEDSDPADIYGDYDCNADPKFVSVMIIQIQRIILDMNNVFSRRELAGYEYLVTNEN